MEEYNKARFGISVEKVFHGSWSFGMCLSHEFEETYLFINFFKWTVSIGFLCEY